MKPRIHLLLVAYVILVGPRPIVPAQGTAAFTHQGRLSEGGGAASGLYDFRLEVYNRAAAGEVGDTLVSSTLNRTAVPVTNGLFVLSLDFCAAPFNGEARWLRIEVRTNNVCGSAANSGIIAPFLGWRLGDDGIGDTLPVQAGDFCFTSRDNVTAANFGVAYGFCTAEQQNLVDNTYLNLMAYGFKKVLDRLTPQQLDKWTRYASNERGFAISGRTRFVSTTGDNANSGLVPTAPKRTVLNAANASTGADIVLLPPSSYNEKITLNQPVTLRVAPTNSFPAYTRSATIGRP